MCVCQVASRLAHVDLSGITSLEGNIKVLATTPLLESAKFEHCPQVRCY